MQLSSFRIFASDTGELLVDMCFDPPDRELRWWLTLCVLLRVYAYRLNGRLPCAFFITIKCLNLSRQRSETSLAASS